MTDDDSTTPYHPGRVDAGPRADGGAGPAGDEAPATPAETGFPYLATQAIQPGGPPDPTTPPGPAPRFRNRRPRRSAAWLPVLIGIPAGLFVLAVLGAYLVWGPTGNPVAGSPTPVSPDSTAAGAVRGYLKALAAGDADAALGFAAAQPEDATLLISPVLRAAHADAPLTAIEVGGSASEATRQFVSARYNLGDQAIGTALEVVRQEDGVWRLPRVAATVDLSALRPREVPLTINGEPVSSSRPALFPGHYTIATTAERYAVENPDFVVPSAIEQPQVRATLTLSERGRDEIIAAAQAHLTDCVKRRKLEPEGCGFAIANPSGTKLKESTMRWAVHSGDDLLAETALTLDQPGSATGSVNIVVRGEVSGTDGSRWKASVRLTRMRADLTGDEVAVQFA